jgi:hypothetical protein
LASPVLQRTEILLLLLPPPPPPPHHHHLLLLILLLLLLLLLILLPLISKRYTSLWTNKILLHSFWSLATV